MSLFQKKPDVTSSAPLYTLSSSKTYLIIGLGNLGKQYDNTRHNVGFAALDDFAARNDFPGWINKKDLKSLVSSHNIGSTRVLLAKPTTLMNNSGEAASLVQKFYRIYNNETLVVYDELAIEFGQIRTRQGGESAGHNGIKSLVQYIGDDFGRVRIGIANDFSSGTESGSFVLGKFTHDEQGSLPNILKEAGVLITEFVFSGELPHQTRSID
jgi:peptidyl-tRNA hydrolase, PTH1 family